MARSLDRLVLFAATAGSMLAASCASRGPTQHPATPAHAPVAAPHGDADADAMAARVAFGGGAFARVITPSRAAGTRTSTGSSNSSAFEIF